MMSNRKQILLLQMLSGLVLLESAWALYALSSFPSEAGSALPFGFSVSRLALMGVILLIFCAALFLLVWGVASRAATEIILKKIQGLERHRAFESLCWLAILLGLTFALTPPERMGVSIYQRLTPLIVLGSLMAGQALLFMMLTRDEKPRWSEFGKQRAPLMIGLGVLLFLLLIWAGIVWSGLGIRREPSGWLSQGTPLLPQQVLLAWGIGLLFMQAMRKFEPGRKMDFLIVVLLWIVTSLVWWREPMIRASYFTPSPTPPNFEYYPYSDAALYDQFAQNILIGTSRQSGLTHRPLYSFFLALLHQLAGLGFQHVLLLQFIVLAVIPPAGYLLASRVGDRTAGVITALLLLLREKNSIALTNIIEVSHAKLLMSDVPTMLLILLFILFYLKWLQDERNRLFLGALAGAFLGLSVFVRSQVLVFIPIALLGFALVPGFNWKNFMQKSLIFLAGVFLIIAPWVWRNYQVSGKFVVEYQEFYTRFIASSYSSAPGDIDRLASETDEQYETRMMRQISGYIIENPLKVARFVSSYFLHNEIASVAYLPLSFRFDNLYDYVKMHGFWDAPYLGEIPARSFPALFIILLILALGIGAAFHRHRWLGIMPILFHLGYSLSVVIVRQSGWRFILPVDWVILPYFGLGLVQLFMLARLPFSLKPEYPFASGIKKASLPLDAGYVFPVLAGIAVVGAAFPLIEWSIPERYPKKEESVLVQMFVTQSIPAPGGERVTASELKIFFETEPGAIVTDGRALYPSWYEEGNFWGESSPNLVAASQFNRIQFTLIGPTNGFVFLSLEQPPQYFPHAADVFVAGCQQKNFFRALVVKVNDQMLVSSPWPGLTCSETE